MDIEGVLAITLIFGTPVLLALIFSPVLMFNHNRKLSERREARETFERLAREKLDVIKTAIAMGRSDSEIAELDARLERLVGADKLQRLLDPKAPAPPPVSAELLDTDIVSEYDRQQGRLEES